MKLKSVKEFTIDRSKWHTGAAVGQHLSALFVQENRRMCCLGFYGNACGLSKVKMTGREYLFRLGDLIVLSKPMEVVEMEEFFEEHLPSDDQEELASINDNFNLSLPAKEKMIKAIFAKRGIKVKFIGKLLP